MELSDKLSIRPGVTAVIGGGGKTTLLRVLGRELSQKGRVLLCTTTKIMAFEGIAKLESLQDEGVLFWAGTPVPGVEKYTAPPWPMEVLMAVFDYVLVEADGSARLPFKAHLDHEPVIPPQANQTIYLVGLTGFSKPLHQVAHRGDLFAQLCGAPLDAPVTPEMVAKVLLVEGLHSQVLCNQADTLELEAYGVALAEQLPCPTHIISLKEYL